MELRVSGTGVDVVKRLGGIPIAMPQSETPEAIQKGVVKGMVSSLEVLKDMNYAAYCPYATDTNLFVVSFAVVMNKDKWNALPADVKKVIDDLRVEQAEWTGKYVDDHVEEALAWSKQKYKHQVIQLPAADKAEIPKLMKPMIDDYIKKVSAQGPSGSSRSSRTSKGSRRSTNKKVESDEESMAVPDRIDLLLSRAPRMALSGAAVLALCSWRRATWSCGSSPCPLPGDLRNRLLPRGDRRRLRPRLTRSGAKGTSSWTSSPPATPGR